MKAAFLYPLGAVFAIFLFWQSAFFVKDFPRYLVASPFDIFLCIKNNYAMFVSAILGTASITLVSLFLAGVLGFFIGSSFFFVRALEKSFYPLTIIVQTTPIVAIAPLLIIWLRNNVFAAMVICALFSCIFPIISSTFAGLNSADKRLIQLFDLYGASKYEKFWKLHVPSSLPYLANGLRISCGLALIGSIVGEFAAGANGGHHGLAYVLIMASYNLEIDKVFASLFLISVLGIFFQLVLSRLDEHLQRKWKQQID